MRVSFSSELKHMTTISNVDGRILSYVKGSPECVLDMCALQPDRLAELCRVLVQAEEQAMRVIAFAHKELAEMEDFSAKEAHRRMESDMVFDGFVAIADPLRSDVYDAVAACRSAGVGVKILPATISLPPPPLPRNWICWRTVVWRWKPKKWKK